MSFAAKIWLVILVTVTLVAGVCIPFISIALPLGVLAILGAAAGFGVSLLIENERRYKNASRKFSKKKPRPRLVKKPNMTRKCEGRKKRGSAG